MGRECVMKAWSKGQSSSQERAVERRGGVIRGASLGVEQAIEYCTQLFCKEIWPTHYVNVGGEVGYALFAYTFD